MKAALKKKWVAALTGGKYEQTGEVLYSKDYKAHCCLGVLRHCVTGRNRYNDYNEMLSDRFLLRVGLTKGQQKKLVRMNDNGSTFKRISAWIERYL